MYAVYLTTVLFRCILRYSLACVLTKRIKCGFYGPFSQGALRCVGMYRRYARIIAVLSATIKDFTIICTATFASLLMVLFLTNLCSRLSVGGLYLASLLT